MRGQPPSCTQYFLFVFSFNVASYFESKKLFYYYYFMIVLELMKLASILCCALLKMSFFYFHLSYFLFTDSILRVDMLRVTLRGKFSLGLNCLEDFFVEVEPDFPTLFLKKDQKLNINKQDFSTQSKEQH